MPATCGVKRLPYDRSYGPTSVRLSCAEWDRYSGHLYHMSAPENVHGDPGDPFPMDRILAAAGGSGAAEEDDLTPAQAKQLAEVHADADWLRKNVTALRDQGVRMTAQGDPDQIAQRETNNLANVLKELRELKALVQPSPPPG